MPLITQPGFYPDITPDQYFSEPCPAPALTNSGIKTLLNSCPAKFAHQHPAIGQPEEDRAETVATHLGSLVHRLALEKGDDYAVSPFDEYRTKEAKAWRDETVASGLIPVKKTVYEQADAMAQRILDAIHIETQGHEYQTEVVFAWKRGNIWCRGMLDVWCPALNLALDVKTCADASDKAVNRAFATGYAGQHAWYSEGIEAISKSQHQPRFGFLFVENAAPFLARYAEPSEGFRHGASMAIDHAAVIFARCMSADKWPGYQPYTAQPPSWWLSEITDIELMEAAE